MDAVFQISDNLLLERVEFRLNGQPAEGVLKDGKYLVHLKEADRAQQLVVKATDASGNTEEAVSYTHLDVYKRQVITQYLW